MPKSNCIEQEGTVKEALSNSNFRVELDVGPMVFCTISGKMRLHNIRLMVGDRVKVELSPYDLTKGRISFRIK